MSSEATMVVRFGPVFVAGFVVVSLLLFLFSHTTVPLDDSSAADALARATIVSPQEHSSSSSNSSPQPAADTLVVYAYWERDDVYAENLRYFLRAGVGSAEESERDGVAYLIIVQGHTLSVDVPPHVRVWKRNNTCYDFGAVGEALRSPELQIPAFRYYIILYTRHTHTLHLMPPSPCSCSHARSRFLFLRVRSLWASHASCITTTASAATTTRNSSVKGPYLPAYWPSSVHWSTIFTSRINDRVKQGTTVERLCVAARIDECARLTLQPAASHS
jgi:hypothetical protein